MIIITSDGEVLVQYGVLGMKWGVRRATTRGSTPPSKRKPKTEDSSVETSSSGHKRVKDMTDAELRSKIQRIQLERQLDSLMQKPPPPKSKGRELVESILYDTGRDLGKKALTHIGTQALDRVLPGFAASQKKEKGKKNATVNDIRNIVDEIKSSAQNGSGKEKKTKEKEPEQKSGNPSPSSGAKKDDSPSTPPSSGSTSGRPAPSSDGYPKGESGDGGSTRKRRFFGGRRGRDAGRGARQTRPSGTVRVPDATVRSISREIVLRGSSY